MNTDRRIALFDAWATTYDRHLETHTAPVSFEDYAQVLDAAVERARVTSGMQVLDLGTGTGNLAARFLDAGCDVWGLDFSAKMLIKAKKKLPQLHAVRASLDNTSWPDLVNRRFDRVVSSYVLHDLNLPSKIRLLGRLVDNNLACGGRIVIADIAYVSQAARTQAQAHWGKLWSAQEHYWAADATINACQVIGLDCTYEQVSSCAGVFVITRAGGACGKDAHRSTTIIVDEPKTLPYDTPIIHDKQGASSKSA